MKRSEKHKRFRAQRQHSIEGSAGGGSAKRKAKKMAGGTEAHQPLKPRWAYDAKAKARKMKKHPPA